MMTQINRQFVEAAEKYTVGDIDFDTFVAMTDKTRRAWVRKLRARLSPIPAWLTEDDTAQDYLVVLYERSLKYQSEKSSPANYMHFGLKNVTRTIQSARGVEQHRRKGPPKFEIVYGLSPRGDWGDSLDASVPGPESEIIRRDYYRILKGLCKTKAQLAVVCALEKTGGSLQDAANELYVDPKTREIWSLNSEKEARLVVHNTVNNFITKHSGKKKYLANV